MKLVGVAFIRVAEFSKVRPHFCREPSLSALYSSVCTKVSHNPCHQAQEINMTACMLQRHGSVWYRDTGQSGTETRVSLVQRHGSVWYRDTGQSGTETRVSLVQRHRSVWYRDTGQSGTDQDTNKMRVVSPHLMSAAMRGTVKFSPSTILSCRIRNPPHSPNRFTMSSNQPCKEQVMSPPCTLIRIY